jgi:hypothetical protein
MTDATRVEILRAALEIWIGQNITSRMTQEMSFILEVTAPCSSPS